MKTVQPIIVGISGASGSGKTTLASSLENTFEDRVARIVHQDNYFKGESCPSYKERTDLETPENIRWDDFASDLQQVAKDVASRCNDGDENSRKRNIIIVEGYLLLAHDELLELFDYLIFLRSTRTICMQRRLGRRSDRTKSEKDALCEYFGKYVWPNYEEHTLKRYENLEHERHLCVDSSASNVCSKTGERHLPCCTICLDAETMTAAGVLNATVSWLKEEHVF